jgi:uncharacterized membrane protein
MNESERWISMIGGGALLLLGLSKKSFGGAILAALGGGLIYRGKTARCPVYKQLGISTNTAFGTELSMEGSTTIYRSVEEVYRFYRDFDNFPRYMKHLDSVTELSPDRSHWVVNLPAGRKLEWDAQIVEDKPGELIRWRSLDGADIQHHGEARFERAPGDRGTEVHVKWKYLPPASGFGAIVGKLANVFTESTLREELHRLKQVLEAGEIATTEGQPSGRDNLEAKENAPELQAPEMIAEPLTLH